MTTDAEPGTAADRSFLARFEGEIGRRLVHASGAAIPLSYLLGVPWSWIQLGLVGGIVVVGLLEALRLRRGLEWWVFEQLTREYEQEKVAGYALYVVSMAAVAVVFEPQIAVPSMLMLAIADPIGGMLGGDDPIPVKRPLALAGTFVVCAAIALPFLPASATVAAAAAATVADGVFVQVRGYVLDDNLTIPVAASVAAAAVLAVIPA